MEARAAATRVPAETAEMDVAVSDGAVTATPREDGRRRRIVARPAVLSREEEYRYIRSDLRRLVVTAGPLLALMIALLFVIEL